MGKTLRQAIRVGDNTNEILARIRRASVPALCGMFPESVQRGTDVSVPLAILKRKKCWVRELPQLADAKYLPVVKKLDGDNLREPIVWRNGPRNLEEYMRASGASAAQIAYASNEWRSLCALAAAVPALPLDVVNRIWLTK